MAAEAFAVGLALLFRWSVGLGPYSGFEKPPMYGDFEAQRHWMEITYHLPVVEWYENTTRNDLQYWGLDYPPLTAYHSWFMGAIAHNAINKSYIELNTSRGFESTDHKLFMRATVLVSDMIIMIPAILVLCRTQIKPRTEVEKGVYLWTLLGYPGLILIDYGHFQYNCVSLGLFLWSLLAILNARIISGTVLFCLALNYKQLELYHAFPLFCYLLGSVLRDRARNRIFLLTKLSLAVLVTFGVCWYPFLTAGPAATLQVLGRLFPFSRGIFEDKVANFWCSTSVIIKWRNLLSTTALVRLCGTTTILALIPSSIMLLVRPSRLQLRIALVISALTFFLFSFHVHEKGILLVAIPMLTLLRDIPKIVCWFSVISVISMYPLCVKDEIQIAFYSLTIAYYVFVMDVFCISPRVRLSRSQRQQHDLIPLSWKDTAIHGTIIIGMCLCLISQLVAPPTRYPDLHAVLLSVYCCALFVMLCLYLYCFQFAIFRELGRFGEKKTKKA